MIKEQPVMNPNEKKITSEELSKLLRNPTNDILESPEGGTAILIDGYTIEDEYFMLFDIEINRKVTFKNCEFNNENLVYIENIECNEDVVFEYCRFSTALLIKESTFKKELCFKYVFLKT